MSWHHDGNWKEAKKKQSRYTDMQQVAFQEEVESMDVLFQCITGIVNPSSALTKPLI